MGPISFLVLPSGVVDSLTRFLGSSFSISLNCSENAFSISLIISSMSGNPQGPKGEPRRRLFGQSSLSSSSNQFHLAQWGLGCFCFFRLTRKTFYAGRRVKFQPL